MKEEKTTNVYEPGDVVVEMVGRIELKDGTVIERGALLSFPVSAPPLPISVVWDRTPLTIAVKAPQDKPAPTRSDELEM